MSQPKETFKMTPSVEEQKWLAAQAAFDARRKLTVMGMPYDRDAIDRADAMASKS